MSSFHKGMRVRVDLVPGPAPYLFVSRAQVVYVQRLHHGNKEDLVDVLGQLPEPLFTLA